jgi:hypothetical protein
MNDQTMNRRAFPELTSLHLPPQAAPIDRTESSAALAGTPGVEAAIFGGIGGILGGLAKKAACRAICRC